MIELTGYSMEDINRLGWYQTLYPDREIQDFARSRLENLNKADEFQTETWEIIPQSGEKTFVSMSSSILKTADDPDYVLILLHDLTEELRLKSEARIDDLSQLLNRRGLIEEARITFKLAAHRMQAVTLAYLDVDDLKTVNDVLGHKEGDRVLKVIGETLKDSIRSIDVAGRLSGDEFAIVLLDMKTSDAKILLSRLHERFNNVFMDNEWDIGMSMGVITFTDFIPDIDDAIEYADSLMYKAKLDGKNKVIIEELSDAIIRAVPRTRENGQKLRRKSDS
jgi:diguanylate cyclase (GGDEF)-like protein/PAS domain S-box-containing protein